MLNMSYLHYLEKSRHKKMSLTLAAREITSSSALVPRVRSHRKLRVQGFRQTSVKRLPGAALLAGRGEFSLKKHRVVE